MPQAPGARSAEAMEEVLRAAGCRITRQRTAVIRYLAGRSDHPSASRIFSELESTESGLSLATVYNTLSTLVEHGLVKQIDFESVDNRYDTNLAPHINLVCTTCGRIDDVEHELPVPPEVIEERLGFSTTEFRIEYRGVCASCRDSSQRGGE